MLPTTVASTQEQRLGPLQYRNHSHAELPHILSFSGGRSSAALAFMSANEGLLRPERGDLLLFANTSAEHPGTYDFAAECKRRLEQEFGLPMLWFEFCTVEDSHGGEYRRRESYRLVKPVPVEDDSDGFRSGGEVFEEMLALQGMMPNPHSRSCTAKLKLYPSHKLLADWLGGVAGPSHSGHHWTDDETGSGEIFVSPEQFVERYLERGGKADSEQVRRRGRYLASRPPQRAEQRFADFTDVLLFNTVSAEHKNDDRRTTPKPAPMRGPNAAQHVRLLGLRSDEPKRVNRVLMRCLYAEGATTSDCTVHTQPPGEHPYFPLHDAGIDGEAVMDFWGRQSFDLDIPEGAGNCTFCFMKGTRQLVALSSTEDRRRTPGAPSDIRWWADVEKCYMRTAPSRNGNGVSRFGFFGVNSGTFEELANGIDDNLGRYKEGTPACDCTD